MPEPKKRYLNYTIGAGDEKYTFVFTYDEVIKDRLHIELRGKTVEDVVDIFFEATEERVNEKWKRIESSYKGQWLWWRWIDEDGKVVLVISCGTKGEY